jgi:hypothetical protein
MLRKRVSPTWIRRAAVAAPPVRNVLKCATFIGGTGGGKCYRSPNSADIVCTGPSKKGVFDGPERLPVRFQLRSIKNVFRQKHVFKHGLLSAPYELNPNFSLNRFPSVEPWMPECSPFLLIGYGMAAMIDKSIFVLHESMQQDLGRVLQISSYSAQSGKCNLSSRANPAQLLGKIKNCHIKNPASRCGRHMHGKVHRITRSAVDMRMENQLFLFENSVFIDLGNIATHHDWWCCVNGPVSRLTRMQLFGANHGLFQVRSSKPFGRQSVNPVRLTRSHIRLHP